MIPVITSTKTDRSAIDLAGVEAGEKMFVLLTVEPPGVAAQSDVADRRNKGASFQPQTKLDFILRVSIYVLP